MCSTYLLGDGDDDRICQVSRLCLSERCVRLDDDAVRAAVIHNGPLLAPRVQLRPNGFVSASPGRIACNTRLDLVDGRSLETFGLDFFQMVHTTATARQHD